MAVTKIHAVKATVHKTITYICNPEKTDESILISSFGCSPETAAYDFKFSLSKTKQSDPNLAFHLIQAFMPGEVSYEEAHQIGTELADKLLEGKHSYIVATHIDKAHIYNHILFCAANNIEYTKYHHYKSGYYHIRHLSDELCKEHQLSVITPPYYRGKKYVEWQAEKNGTSLKSKLKSDIDEAILSANTYEEFLDLIRAKEYEIKGETFGYSSLKYISFRPNGHKHFIRGKTDTLGADYTKETIKKRIEKKPLAQSKKESPFKTKRKSLLKDYSSKKLIDTNEEKFENSPALKHWADIENLKIAASNYSDAGSISELEEQIKTKAAMLKSTRKNLVETERQLKDLGEIIKYAEQYSANHIYYIRYRKSKNKEAYLQRHETELLLYDGAEHMLKRAGINLKTLDIEKLRNEYNALYSEKKELQNSYHSVEKEHKNLQQKLENLNQFLNKTQTQPIISKKVV